MIKKILCFMLAVVLTIGLCACQSTSGQVNSSGTGTGSSSANTLNTAVSEDSLSVYDEKEIGANSALKSPVEGRVNSKNQLVVMENSNNNGLRFVTLDEEGKQVGEVKCGINGYITDFALDSQDRIIVMVTESGKDSVHIQKLVVIDSTGKTVDTFETGKYKSDGNVAQMVFIMDLALDKSDSVYLATSKGLRILDKTGKETNKIGSDLYYSVDITSDGKIAAVRSAAGKQELVLIDPATGDDIWVADPSAQSSDGVKSSEMIEAINIGFDRSNGSICYMDENGVTRYDTAGKPVGRVLDFNQYMILASGNTPVSLGIDGKGSFYILTTSQSAYEILRYDIANGTHKAKSRKVLTLAVPTTPRWLTVAAGKFQKANQDYRVEIKDYGQNSQSGQASASVQNAAGSGNENYVKTLNTELLTGKGPDLFAVNGLSYEKYVTRNILADLSEYMKKDGGFDDSGYYMNILNALKVNGKQFALPVSISFDLLAANKTLMDKKAVTIDDTKWTWDDFGQTGEKLAGKDNGKSAGVTLFPQTTSSSLLESMLKGYYSSFVDVNSKKASFDSKEFADLLNIAKTYGVNDKAEEMTVSGANYVEPASVENDTVVFSMQSFSDYTGYAFLGGLYKEKLKLLRCPSVGEGKNGVFNSDSVFAINNNSKNKDAAWEFLKFLMSDEIQSGELSGFAVRKDSLKKVADRAIEMTNSGSMAYAISSSKDGNNGKPVIITPKKLTQSDIDFLNGFIADRMVFNNSNAEIEKIVSDEAAGFFSGNKSAEDTVKIIQQKVNIYLGE